MGKIRTRVIGDQEIEEKQKKEQKERSKMKKINSDSEDKKEEVTLLDTDQQVKGNQKKSKKKEELQSPTSSTNKRGKKYLAAKSMVDKKKHYSIKDAVATLKKVSYAGFKESVEIHLNVNESGIKGEVEFPYSTGKVLKIKIVDDKVIEAIEKGVIDFDILISHPSYMPKLTKFAKVLGPRGLMPNPKAGTISTNPESVAKKFSGGTIKWKGEPKFPLAHQIIAKLSSPESEIEANAEAYLKAVGKSHIQKAYIKSTMSPSLMLDLSFLG